MDKQIWTVKDVAEYLELAQITIYKYVSSRKIPFYKVGSNVRFRRDQIDIWLENKRIDEIGGSR